MRVGWVQVMSSALKVKDAALMAKEEEIDALRSMCACAPRAVDTPAARASARGRASRAHACTCGPSRRDRAAPRSLRAPRRMW